MVELKRIYWSRQALRLAYSAVVVWLSASIVLSLMPEANPPDSQSAATVAEISRGMVVRVLAAVTVPGLFLVILTIVGVVIRARDMKRRDRVRRFSPPQRREGMTRAGGQCEMESGLRRRCSRPAEHGDHFYPWSKGGSTSLQNFVAACAKCNRAKGARIPSPGQQARIERRRRADLPPAGSVRVGARQPLS